jgi:hypothetical protein
MTSTLTDRRYGVAEGLAVKAPVRVSATSAITLAGLQTIDGVTLVADDRVLVQGQADSVDNGIYVASSGNWTRALDFDGSRDSVRGTLVFVLDGTEEADKGYRVATSNPIVVGTSEITFELFDFAANGLNYTAPVDGAVAGPYIKKFSEEISIRDFLSEPVKDDYHVFLDNDIATAITNFLIGGNCTLRLPPGLYEFTDGATNPSTGGTGYCFIMQGTDDDGTAVPCENVSIIGAGPGSTTVYGADGADLGFVSFSGTNNILVQGIRFENDRDSNAEADGSGGSQHGFVGSGSEARGWGNTNCTVRDVQVIGARGYGIGLQGSTGQDTYYQNWTFDNVLVENCSNDGIDVKNPTDTENNNFRLNNVTIKNFALQQDYDTRVNGEDPPVVVGDGDLWRNAEYAGIDIRSAWTHMTNITVIHDAEHTGNPAGSGLGAGARDKLTHGFAHRARSNGTSNRMHISNFYISLSNNGVTASNEATVGIDFEGDWCTAVGGYIENCDRALSSTGDYNKFSMITIDNCHLGVTGGPTNSFDDITITNATSTAVITDTETKFSGIKVEDVADANYGHWVAAEQGNVDLTGLKWTDADELSWVSTIGNTLFTFPNTGQTGIIWRASPTSVVALTPVEVWEAMGEVALTDAATIAVDLSTGFDFRVTLADNRTLGNPTNVKVGQRGRFRITQDGTGSRTLAFASNYEFASGTAIILSTAINSQDVIYYDCISASRILLTLGARAIS